MFFLHYLFRPYYSFSLRAVSNEVPSQSEIVVSNVNPDEIELEDDDEEEMQVDSNVPLRKKGKLYYFVF